MKPKSIKFVPMTIQEANNRLLFQLYQLYGNSEAANIADLVMEKVTGWKRIDRVINKHIKLSAAMEDEVERYTMELVSSAPVQYVLNEAWFYGLKFYVDKNVLIPRPETEELTEWILKTIQENEQPLSVVDIGTGSGCIAVAIKKFRPDVEVYACDVSNKALDVARTNALNNSVEITFYQADVLQEKAWELLSALDIIVSNPPYIPANGKLFLQPNVIEFEPHSALFVEDDDPLIFYKKIAAFGRTRLKMGGKIFVEAHEELAHDTAEVFYKEGYSGIEIRKDMQGKERMIKAVKK